MIGRRTGKVKGKRWTKQRNEVLLTLGRGKRRENKGASKPREGKEWRGKGKKEELS